jgi:hypothetical protein
MGLMETGQSTCDVCGDALPEGAYFCGECGASVPDFGAPIETSARRVAAPERAMTDGNPPADNDPAPEVPATPAEPVPVEPVAAAPVSTPSVPVAGAAAVVTPFTLVFSTGERAQIVGRGLIGRMPVAPANEICDHLIVVSDPSKTVSKTHLRVEALAEGLMVTDLDSANGTVVSMPGIAAERLAPHERVILMSGATVGIGDQSFTIQ